MGAEILSLDFDMPKVRNVSPNMLNFSSIGGEANSANYPYAPSLIRKANSRYLMKVVDTNILPDFATLTDISYDHDLFTALGMISVDTVRKMKLYKESTEPTYKRKINELDEIVDIQEHYSNTDYDELRYGNSVTLKRMEDGVFVDFNIVHPGKIKSMKLGPNNKPMWWVFSKGEAGTLYTNYGDNDVAFVNDAYMKEYEAEGLTSNIVGIPDEVVHFKGSALRYQTWGVGIAQLAKLLIETKIDYLVDSSKIIKMSASPKEYLYVNVAGLNDDAAQKKIDATIADVSVQRQLSSIIVLGKDEAEAQIIGNEGKVLDNFTLHYRDYILESIRMLTRVPPSFWIGESTNKATVNSHMIVYNGFIDSGRNRKNKKYQRELYYPYLKQFDNSLSISTTPEITFIGQAIEDQMDKMTIDDIAIRNGSKSRHQVADEWNFRLPEDDGEEVPSLGGSNKFESKGIDNLTEKLAEMVKPDV